MYTDAFGNYTLPPSEYGYDSFILTGNATFVWPYNTDGSPYSVAKVMDFTCLAGNVVTLPNATEVSTGEDFLIRNVGANPLTVHNADGVQIATVAIGAASYFYLTDNTSSAGVYGVIGFGVGTSTADAASLVGYGIKAVGASLNQAHPVFPSNTGLTFNTDHRAKLVVFTGGVATFALTAAATLGDDYFTMFRNEGTGTATIDPASSELIDGMGSMQVQPGESLMLICTGTQWYSVGYGRSTLYQFTQLTKDVSAGGTITLTAAEAANKLITFIGNPTGAVSVVVPSIVAVYYTQSSISTAHTVTLKTAAGSGTGIDQGARIIALCDGTNVVSAQSAVANTSVSLTDGSAAVPSLYFATQTDTGLFKSSTQDLGITVAGTSVGVFGSTGLQTSTVGPNSTQRHTLPAVSSDTIALLAAAQTLTNKSVYLGTNTLTGTLAQFNTALSDGDFASLAGVETLTNKTISGASNTLSSVGNASLTNSSITINGNSVALGGSTTVTATASNALTIGTGLSGTSYNGSAPVTIAIDSTVATLAGSQTLTNKTITGAIISGGSINNTPIGGTTPAAGAFTSLSASGALTTNGLKEDSSGNLGLGTSSPGAKLESVQGASGASGWFMAGQFSAANYPMIRFAATTPGKYSSIGNNADGSLQFLVNGTSGAVGTAAAVLDPSGNLGLGVTPSAWYTALGLKAIQIGDFALANQTNGYSWLSRNAYSNSSNIQTYISDNYATRYQQGDGQHRWFTAPSGTAGDPISFGDAKMTLDASGNLLVGKTVTTYNTDGVSLSSQGANVSATSTAVTAFNRNGTDGTVTEYYKSGTLVGSVSLTSTTATYNTTSDHRLKENVRPANAARFMDIEFVDFEWVDGRHDCGVIAHQLQSVYPDLVLGEKDATEIRQVEIEPAIPAVTEQQLVTEAVLDEEGNEVTPAVYETVEITPAVEAVTEDQTFPVYQQVNYIGLIGRMGTVIQKQQRMIEAMEARLSALEAA